LSVPIVKGYVVAFNPILTPQLESVQAPEGRVEVPVHSFCSPWNIFRVDSVRWIIYLRIVAFISSSITPRDTVPVQSRWRRIVTPIPVPESIPVIERLRAVEPVSMSAMPPVLWDEAEGFLVRDPYGNQWIDLTSAIVMANAGHSHPRIVEAIHRAADGKLLATYAFPATGRSAVLEKLVSLSPIPDSKAILFSAGTEATEAAMFVMRLHGRAIDPEKVGILSFAAGYHGRTLAASMAAGTPRPDDWISRGQLHHYQIPFPFSPACVWGHDASKTCDETCFERCIELLDQRGVKPERIAGFIGEPAPGWATLPIPPRFAEAMKSWADEHNILICFDEVQSGCGRTGRWFGFEHTGVVPDLFTLGKGLSSSLPVSALVGRGEIMDLPPPGEMSSTHGGNPLCAEVALASLQVIEEEDLVRKSADTGERVLKVLQGLRDEFPDRFMSVNGRGLYISAHFVDPVTGEPDVRLADEIAETAVRRGVMMFVTGRGLLKLAPPLCIDPEAAIEAAEVIRECFQEYTDA
jgi:4-aminobutyrate aminotransferase/diaminobutyrate-pyruvate transaminase/4-aminobutyrate aminotransferase/(S)-3-amino-2-methylpropionate transaminase